MTRRDPLELDIENAQVLNLVQAMIGLVPANLRAASLACAPGKLQLYFVLATDDALDREAIDDIVFEFEALQERLVPVAVSVLVSSTADAVSGLPGRRVFGRLEQATHPPVDSVDAHLPCVG
jgi:hypothetical protein